MYHHFYDLEHLIVEKIALMTKKLSTIQIKMLHIIAKLGDNLVIAVILATLLTEIVQNAKKITNWNSTADRAKTSILI